MPDKTEATNTMATNTRGRSMSEGDVPESVMRRYFTDGRGGAGLGFYADARVDRPSFRDEGKRLATTRADPNAIRDMTLIAKHRGWAIVTVQGDKDFRREAWVTGRALGIEVRGYRPSERDLQELERRTARAAERGVPQAEPRKGSEQARRDRVRVVEAVLKARLTDPKARDRILSNARDKLATWLERGASVKPLDLRQAPDLPSRKERSRIR